MSTKHVYSFGGKTADGDGKHEGTARRQGGQPRRDVQDRHPRPARASPSPPRSAPPTTSTARRSPRPPCPQIDEALEKVEKPRSARSSATRPTRCSSRVRSGAALSMPGHDEHHPQPRPDRRQRRGPGEEDRQPALRLRQLPPRSSTCSAPPRWASSTSSSSTRSTRMKDEKRVKLDTDLTADDLKELVEAVQGGLQEARRRRLPARPEEAADARRSTPCSTRGTATRRSSTAASSGSPA